MKRYIFKEKDIVDEYRYIFCVELSTGEAV